MNEKDARQSSADAKAYARLEDDVTAVKNDIARLAEQMSEAMNALGAVAQGQARRGLRLARACVDSMMSDAIEARPVAMLATALALGFLIGATSRR